MAFVHGKTCTVLVNDSDVSRFFNDISWANELDAVDVTNFGSNGSKEFIAGLADSKISAAGLFDGTAVTGSDEILAAALAGGDQIVLTALGANAVGVACKIAAGVETTYEVAEKVTDVVTTKAEFQANGGADSGKVLAAARSVATATTTNEVSVDRGASTANGGIAQLHVTANASNNTTVVKVQHSANNSTWADLATFTTVGAADTTAEQVEVAGTVNRYLRAISTTAGTGAVVYTVAFARR